MAVASSAETDGSLAGRVLGRKMDSIPFSFYQVLIIAILALIGFIEGYDLFLTGSLLVLAKLPLHLTGTDVQWLFLGPTIGGTIGGFSFSAVGERLSRKSMLLIGVIATTFLTLLIPLVQTAEQLIVIRSLTALGAAGVWSAVYPVAAELMPAQHRRTNGAIYEMALASSFTVTPFVAALLSANALGFRLLALPGGLALLVVPAIVYLLLPESPRWHLRRGEAEIAVDIVNRIIARSGNRVPPLTLAALGDVNAAAREKLPPYWALLAKGQLRWTVVGAVAVTCAGCAAASISALLPKALTEQGYPVAASLGITSIIFLTSFFGKAFTGWLMEIIGRRWTICFVMAGSLPGFCLMLLAHTGGQHARSLMIAGGLIIGFTVVSSFSAIRVYLSEQFPTALRGRGHIFGESVGRIAIGGGLMPFVLAPHTNSPAIFFGTLAVVVALGAFVPVVFGKETVGQLEAVAEEVPVLA
jgi:MFS family permease